MSRFKIGAATKSLFTRAATSTGAKVSAPKENAKPSVVSRAKQFFGYDKPAAAKQRKPITPPSLPSVITAARQVSKQSAAAKARKSITPPPLPTTLAVSRQQSKQPTAESARRQETQPPVPPPLEDYQPAESQQPVDPSTEMKGEHREPGSLIPPAITEVIRNVVTNIGAKRESKKDPKPATPRPVKAIDPTKATADNAGVASPQPATESAAADAGSKPSATESTQPEVSAARTPAATESTTIASRARKLFDRAKAIPAAIKSMATPSTPTAQSVPSREPSQSPVPPPVATSSSTESQQPSGPNTEAQSEPGPLIPPPITEVIRSVVANVGAEKASRNDQDAATPNAVKAIDRAQALADVAGIADPTPFTDIANAAVYKMRAKWEPGRKKEHERNAAISAISAVPFIGDLAKLKRGKAIVLGLGWYGEKKKRERVAKDPVASKALGIADRLPEAIKPPKRPTARPAMPPGPKSAAGKWSYLRSIGSVHTISDSLAAGKKIPQDLRGSMLPKMVAQSRARGYSDDTDQLRIARLFTSHQGDNEKLSEEFNRHFPKQDQASPKPPAMQDVLQSVVADAMGGNRTSDPASPAAPASRRQYPDGWADKQQPRRERWYDRLRPSFTKPTAGSSKATPLAGITARIFGGSNGEGESSERTERPGSTPQQPNRERWFDRLRPSFTKPTATPGSKTTPLAGIAARIFGKANSQDERPNRTPQPNRERWLDRLRPSFTKPKTDGSKATPLAGITARIFGGSKERTGSNGQRQQPGGTPQPTTFAGKTQAAFGNGLQGMFRVAGFGRDQQAPTPGSSTASAEALRSGSNFGDVMSGKKKLSEATEETEAESKAKEKLIDTTKRLGGRFATLAIGAMGLTKAVEAVSASMVARQRHLAEYNGNIALAAANLDIGRTHRDIEKSSRTAGSFEKLTQAQNALEDELLDFKVTSANAMNRIIALLARGTQASVMVAKVLINAIPGMASALKVLEVNSEPSMPAWTDFLDDIAKGYADAPKKKRRI